MTKLIINPSLDAISKALDTINHPENSYSSIIVGGTNGKGSVCTFLELLYLELKPKLKIAKYTSPHLVSITERFCINGKEISLDEYQLLEKELETYSKNLSAFEKETLIAFEYFKRQKVDIAIIEVGLGGRWDATNVVATEKRLATVITNISFDHMDYLGDTLEKIRFEKEGIKREGSVHFEGRDIQGDTAEPNSINGVNSLLALDIFQSLNSQIVDIQTQEKIIKSFKHRGRFDYDPRRRILVDGAHNPAAMQVLNKFIAKNFNPNITKIYVLGFLDKDYRACIDELFDNNISKADLIIATQPDSERSTNATYIYDYIYKKYSVKAENLFLVPNSNQAFNRAFELQNTNDLVVISGSLKLIGEYFQIITQS